MRELLNCGFHRGINAVVRCVSVTSELQEFTSHCWQEAGGEGSKSVTVALRDLLNEMTQHERCSPCDPTPLIASLNAYNGVTYDDQEQDRDLFRGKQHFNVQQEDADFIFQYILNALANEGDPKAEEASRMWDIEKQHSMKCLSCYCDQQVTSDRCNNINVDMNKDTTKDLQGYINQYSESFTVPDHYCENCGAATGLQVTTVVSRLPPLVCVRLGRVKNIGRDDANIVKIETPFSFPQNLDLSPLLTEPTGGQGPDDQVLYELYGVVAHLGSVSDGHYIAYVQDGKKWYLDTDSHTTPCSWECVQRTYQKRSPFCAVAHMLMYRKKVADFSAL